LELVRRAAGQFDGNYPCTFQPLFSSSSLPPLLFFPPYTLPHSQFHPPTSKKTPNFVNGSASVKMAVNTHPYYPEHVVLSGNFIENTWTVPSLILTFVTGCTLLLFITLVVLRRINPVLRSSDQWKVLWFIMSEVSGSAK
jgi:hypothetical protein